MERDVEVTVSYEHDKQIKNRFQNQTIMRNPNTAFWGGNLAGVSFPIERT